MMAVDALCDSVPKTGSEYVATATVYRNTAETYSGAGLQFPAYF